MTAVDHPVTESVRLTASRSTASSCRTIGSVAALVIALLGADVALRTVHAAQNPVPPKLLTAQEFRLVDKEGATRASIARERTAVHLFPLIDKANSAENKYEGQAGWRVDVRNERCGQPKPHRTRYASGRKRNHIRNRQARQGRRRAAGTAGWQPDSGCAG